MSRRTLVLCSGGGNEEGGRRRRKMKRRQLTTHLPLPFLPPSLAFVCQLFSQFPRTRRTRSMPRSQNHGSLRDQGCSFISLPSRRPSSTSNSPIFPLSSILLQVGSYHYCSGVEASSSASLAAYLNSLTFAVEDGNAWFSKGPIWKVRGGTYW